MKRKKNILDKNLNKGLLFSYELTTETLTIKLFGVIRLKKIALEDIFYLRLATADELPPGYIFLNWRFFTQRSRSHSPVYVLYLNRRNRILIKLKGGAHYKLRKAIADTNRVNRRKLLDCLPT